MPQYALARHVFVCVQGEHVVFLDVRNDRYLALEAVKTAGLADVVAGWPVPSPQAQEYVPDVSSLLLERGILVSDPRAGKLATPVHAPSATSDIADESADESGRFGPLVLIRFARAAIVTALLLKLRSLDYVIERVRQRKMRANGSSGSVDVERAQRLVSAFTTLRPFVFAAKDACLFDALALSEFLSAYGIYPEWVFGVQGRPFAAHCWLQHQGWVLNDTADHVRRYTPIMIV